jgi:type II secretory pathway pseudopilin PulG
MRAFHRTTARRRSANTGFSLVEAAIAVFVITLLLGSILVPLTTQVEQRRIAETQRTLDELKEALYGFAIANGHLPCPDKTGAAGAGTANDGLEDVNAGLCVANEGNLPWATLGTGSVDPWGNRFRYAVSSNFSRRAPATPAFGFGTTSAIEVCAIQTCATRLTNVSDGPPAVLLSHGPNGRGAFNSLTGAANPAASSADETENTDADNVFVSRSTGGLGSTGGEFDDLVVWLSRSVLLNRMVASGRLPSP